MNIKKKLEELLIYYHSTRGKGHSTLVKNGVENSPSGEFFVLVHKMDCPVFDSFHPNEKISLHNLEKLRGHTKPLAIDNAALMELFSESLMRIEALEEQNKKLEERNQTILVTSDSTLWKKVDQLEQELETLRNQGKTIFIGKKRHRL